jgi:hypothetical protein
MTAAEFIDFIILPIFVLAFGIACFVFPKQTGVGFCRLGRRIWKLTTFGLTDMRWFYPEDKAPSLFRLSGIFVILLGVWLVIVSALSFFGPGSFYAMREAEG